MIGEMLARRITESLGKVPSSAEILQVRSYSNEELERRATRMISLVREAYELPLRRGDWRVEDGRVMVHLPNNGHLSLYRASGAMELKTGLRPMEALIGPAKQEELNAVMRRTADRLGLMKWAGGDKALRFERLWQIKASASSPEGKMVEPVVCRVVGAYRQYANDLPVLGPASAAVKLAGEGMLDTLTLALREPEGEAIDKAEIISPERGAREMVLQLSGLVGKQEEMLEETAELQWAQFGYLNLPKRKAQRLLAPVFVAAVVLGGKQFRQGYILAAPATERPYLEELRMAGHAQPVTSERMSDRYHRSE